MKTPLKNSGLLLLLTIIFSCSTLHAQKKNSEKSLLWKISGNGLKESSYLFGTYHLLGDKFLSEVPETTQPFAKAKGIVVELVIDSAKMINAMMSKSIMLNNKISSLLSPGDFKLVDSVLQSLSAYHLTSFDMFKPAQVSIMLSLLQTQKLNAELLKKYEGVPLDIHFATSAKNSGKTVIPLETLDQQLDMLYNHFTPEEQAKQLVETAKQIDLTATFSVEMTQNYLKKDLDALLSMMEALPKEISGNSDHMLKDRNHAWVTVLTPLMKTGSQFIAVGAGHLPGPDGLITLLRKEGYTVTPVVK